MLYSGLFQNRILEVSLAVGIAFFASLVSIQIFIKPKKKITRIIDTMEALTKSSVHIKNRDYVEEVVSQLIKGSASKLQVIADFDQTISRVHKNGKACPTTYGILEMSPFMSDEYRKQTTLLFEKYHPIEVDPTLSKAEKIPYMIEWYTKSNGLMPTSGITKNCVPKVVAASNACLREGCESLFNSLYRHDVPLLIFSAGVGDVLKEVLHQFNLLLPNIKIIANFMNFNEKNQLLGFKDELIHTFNKNHSSVKNKDYFEHLKSRDNIILLGDSLGDLDMADGIQDINAILKIGFLNRNIESNLPQYMDAYDIVLTDDQTMDVVVGLLQSIL